MTANQAKPGYIYDSVLDDWVPIAGIMDTSKAYTFSADQTFNGELTANGAVDMSGADYFIPPQQLANRNLIYNGAMQVHQRGTSTASITSSGYYTADRWNNILSGLGTWTQSVENDAPTGSGLRKSVKMLCTTADASPAASDYCLFEQQLEGQDVQRIAKGTSSAQQVTVSFWVKSNVTGTYVVFLQDYDNTRSVSLTYSISASATWEKKTITFPADTTGVLDNDNNGSFGVRFILGAGTNWTSGTRNETWQNLTLANIGPGQTANVAAATNNYWQVTGVQLEVGPVATPFEFEDYGTTLRKCQRYFHQSGRAFSTCTNGGFNNSYASTITYPVTLRISSPNLTIYSGGDYSGSSGNATWYPGGAVQAANIETQNENGHSISRLTVNSYTLVTYSYKVSAEL